LTKAEVHYSGRVILKTPAILKSFCKIDVEYFPFDIQTCKIKFSSWTYDYKNILLTHKRAKRGNMIVRSGIDFKSCLESDEWDIVDSVAKISVDPPEDESLRANFYPGMIKLTH
jgi:nicotinic acetylcholine receptor